MLFGLKNQELANELTQMFWQDQQAAANLQAALGQADDNELAKLILAQLKLNYQQTERIKQIIDSYGWPGNKLVGAEGAQAAWLLVQHADYDLAFQKKALDLLAAAVQAGDANPQHLAYLIDRVRVAENLPQLYGTQFHGSSKPLPVEDEARVDERRAAIGLPPYSQYLQQMQQLNAKISITQRLLTIMERVLVQATGELPAAVISEASKKVAELRTQLGGM